MSENGPDHPRGPVWVMQERGDCQTQVGRGGGEMVTEGPQGSSPDPDAESDKYLGAGSSCRGWNEGWDVEWGSREGHCKDALSRFFQNVLGSLMKHISKLSWGMKERSIFLLSNIPCGSKAPQKLIPPQFGTPGI